MTHQAQPSRTSCGPTCVAMLAGVPARDVIALLPSVRSSKRKSRPNHGTNVAEMIRLLNRFGLTLEPRIAGVSGVRSLLRVHRARPAGGHRAGWHWCVCLGQPDAEIHSAQHRRVVHCPIVQSREHKVYSYPVADTEEGQR
jgi:hypothetical protein